MKRKSLIHIVVGLVVLAFSACDRSAESGGDSISSDNSEHGSAGRLACVDPETGKLIEPGPDDDCIVPEQAESDEEPEPVVKDLEGGGKVIDPKGTTNQNQTSSGSANRMVVIDRKTGKLLTQRPSDPKAAIRYDRSVARATAILKRQLKDTPAEIVYPEVMANGGMKIDPKGRFLVPLIAKRSEDGQIEIRHQHQ
ncbi:MAG: hypothetical protein ACR2QF_12630 [Geminicoccaceae bacterium]